MRLRLRMAGRLVCYGRGVGDGPWVSWVKRHVVFMCAWMLLWVQLHVRVRVCL